MRHSVFVAGNAGTGKSKVPAYLHSVVLTLHCKEIAMVLAENILHVAFASGSSGITHCSGHPISHVICNGKQILHFTCCLHVPKEN